MDNIMGHSVFDVASGRGYMVEKIYEAGYEVMGTDIVLSEEQKKLNRYTEGNIVNLPFADKSYDTVICTHVLEHIRDYRRAISEVIRVTNKRLIVVIPKQREGKYTPDLHVNFCPYIYRFKQFLKEGGLKIDEADFFELDMDFVCVYDVR